MSDQESKGIIFSKLGSSIEEPVIISLMQSAFNREDLISLAAGFTDNEVVPHDLIQEALADLNSKYPPEHLQYGSNQGRPLLREHVCELLKSYPNEDASKYTPDDILISNGSQQSLYLAMQALCDRGDIVLVEGPSYFVFLELLRGLGIEARTMPMLANGCIDLEGLREELSKARADGTLEKYKAVYLVSYYSNPSGHSMPLSDKEGLAAVLREFGLIVPILEDAAYRDVHHVEAHPVPSVTSIEAFEGFPALYFGTFSKCVSSGIKVGYAYSNEKLLLEKMLRIKGHQDFGTANMNQAIMEHILDSGKFQDYVKTLHAHYKAKFDVFEELAAEYKIAELGFTWESPKGGLMQWVKGPEGFDISLGSESYNACLDNGVFFVPGDLCFADRTPKNCVRLSVGTPETPILREGLARFFKTMNQILSKQQVAGPQL